MKVYIAAPFFNKQQLKSVIDIENQLDDVGIPYFSPRLNGVLLDMSKEEIMESKKKIFDDNVYNLDQCTHMVAVIDGRDTGTIWEMGYFYCDGKPIVSISFEGHGVNVMLAESVLAHVDDLGEMTNALVGNKWEPANIEGIY